MKNKLLALALSAVALSGQNLNQTLIPKPGPPAPPNVSHGESLIPLTVTQIANLGPSVILKLETPTPEVEGRLYLYTWKALCDSFQVNLATQEPETLVTISWADNPGACKFFVDRYTRTEQGQLYSNGGTDIK
jgi:hypothetical protein